MFPLTPQGAELQGHVTDRVSSAKTEESQDPGLCPVAVCQHGPASDTAGGGCTGVFLHPCSPQGAGIDGAAAQLSLLKEPSSHMLQGRALILLSNGGG